MKQSIKADGLQHDTNGKWISVLIQPEVVSFLIGIKTELKKRNLKIGQSEIANKLLEIGLENIDKEEVLKNPLTLWEIN